MIAALVEGEIDMALGVFADLPPQIEAQLCPLP